MFVDLVTRKNAHVGPENWRFVRVLCFIFFYIAWTNKSSVVRKPVLAQSVPTGAPVEMYVTIDF